MVITKKEELEAKIRDMIRIAGSGHYASSVSALDIMYPLFYERGVKPDEFILSKGHAAPALYTILHDLGYLTEEDLQSFRKIGGLPGHPSIETPGVLCSSGSLGMGISKAIGLAWANPNKTYHVLVGDGELQEGQNWEAIQYLRRESVVNVVIHIDINGHQYSGKLPDRCMLIVYLPNFIVHNTTWDHDNSYLCKPKEKDYMYAQELIKAMQSDERIVALDADLKFDFGLESVERDFPDRFIECGISEQHMVSMAGGLARAGKIPICHTFGAFYRRAIDQIYNNACDGLHVGYVAGLIDHGTTNIGKSHETSFWGNVLRMTGISYAPTIDGFFQRVDNFAGVYLEV